LPRSGTSKKQGTEKKDFLSHPAVPVEKPVGDAPPHIISLSSSRRVCHAREEILPPQHEIGDARRLTDDTEISMEVRRPEVHVGEHHPAASTGQFHGRCEGEDALVSVLPHKVMRSTRRALEKMLPASMWRCKIDIYLFWISQPEE
jgi:hypothetical protein